MGACNQCGIDTIALRCERDALRRRNAELEAALRLPLLFHALGWEPDAAAEWRSITGKSEATTRVMCDHIRALLSPAPQSLAAAAHESMEALASSEGETDK